MSVISLEDARKKLEKRLASESQSKQSIQSEELGLTLTEEDVDQRTIEALIVMFEVLSEAWIRPFTTKSKFARDKANMVAVAATENLITTRLNDEIWGNRWLITDDGLSFMKEIEDDLVN